MNIQEALTEYRFKNVGQFRGIASSLGYSEEYNKGNIRFTRGDDDFRTNVDKIRSCTKNEPDLSAESASMERICKFFDRDQALNLNYKEALAKEEVDIINWGDLKGDVKDRFTVIDHKNKICYTGKELYDYALQNGYLLDGKGTQLEKGVLSALTDVKGKPAKIRLTENGISIHYRKETLVIPESILGKKLSKRQQQDLLNGDVIVLSSKKGHVFLQIDKDLNSVVVRSEKELSIPAKIGGYELTVADKYLLANGFSMDNKIMQGENGYFIADVTMNADKKGFAFSNIQMISASKAMELQKKNEQSIAQDQDLAKDPQARNFDAELKEAVAKNDYEKISQLKDEGYKPSEEVIKGLGADSKIDEKQAVVIEKIFGIKPEVTTQIEKDNSANISEVIKRGKSENDLAVQCNRLYNQAGDDPQKKERVMRAYNSVRSNLRSYGFGTELGDSYRISSVEQRQFPLEKSNLKQGEINGNEIVISATSEMDVVFKSALGSNDFEKMSQLKEQGYQPSKELLQSLDSVSDNTMIAVQKIFGMKGAAPGLNDVKLAQSKPDKDLSRPLASAVNRAFSDL